MKIFTVQRENGVVVPQILRKCGSCKCDEPLHIYQLMEKEFHPSNLLEEHIWGVFFNNKNKVLGISEAAVGTVDTAIISPREMLLRALAIGAVSFAMIHNHPSGDVNPSSEDISVSKKMKEAGDVINIRFLDSIIVGDGYMSMRESGLL